VRKSILRDPTPGATKASMIKGKS